MEKKHIITIAGSLGSGKSSTANKVAELLDYTRASTGDFMRSLADKKGISLEELSKIAENDNGATDKEIDDNSRAIREKSNIVLDSRLGFFFIPESFKVFLKLDPEIAINRIIQDSKTNPNRKKETTGSLETPESVFKAISLRRASEQKRYQELYGIADSTAPENFNLVIDTATISLIDVTNKIVEDYKKWLHE
jgi:CMP/dCMP kinase